MDDKGDYVVAETIRIQMMDHFLIYIDEKKTDHLAAKSKKGAALIQFLILNEGEPVPNQRLLSTLWDEEKSIWFARGGRCRNAVPFRVRLL